MKRRRLIVVRSAALDIQRRNRWWKRNRKEVPVMFAEAVRAGYAALEENAGIGSPFETAEVDGVHRYQFRATQHWLYYVVRDIPTLPSHVVVLGIEGPGEAGPPNLVKAAREI